MKALLRLVLVLDAALIAVLAALFLAAPLSMLFEVLQLPTPNPALYGQLLGLMLLAWALLASQASWSGQLTVPVASKLGYIQLASALLIVAWLMSGMPNLQTLGRLLMAAVAVVLMCFSLILIKLAAAVRRREKAATQILASATKPADATVSTVYPVSNDPLTTQSPACNRAAIASEVSSETSVTFSNHARQNPDS